MGLMEALIAQAKNPRGWVGKMMIGIMNKAHTAIVNWAFSHIQMMKLAPVLDIGCGGGQTLQLLASRMPDTDIYGLDYSQQAVDTSIHKNKEVVAAGRMNLPNDIKEIYRVLDHGGTLIVVSEIYKINYHMTTHTTNEEMELLYRQAGFQSVQIHENTKWRCYIGVK
ncbi:SAM-dependent methyltransferase [Paenibacillus albidus]|uniref:SAM-dependent methyltransferase n=1 Tax=Paenibacillus albidus TaxID=2041023 RepID=A0A917C3C0_9BACL|nr:class I SAM-dependent methyltransferase [Paenibacillus albidus]GGF69941.1 SAM-dependent methyltransferase [Paenibacillus albidus]